MSIRIETKKKETFEVTQPHANRAGLACDHWVGLGLETTLSSQHVTGQVRLLIQL